MKTKKHSIERKENIRSVDYGKALNVMYIGCVFVTLSAP